MNRTPSLILVVLFVAATGRAAEPDTKTAIEKGLRRLEEGAGNYVKRKACFSCHHQALTMHALYSARQRGFTTNEDRECEQIAFTLDTFKPKLDAVRKGTRVEGGNTMAAYALFALEGVDHKPDEVTDALIEYLLGRQKPDGSWPAIMPRPPTEGSSFTNTALTIRALKVYAPKGEARARAIEKGRDWLVKNEPKDMEDRVFLLRGLVSAEADPRKIVAVSDGLMNAQNKDGSWSQIPNRAGDAYATGTVLMALRAAGMKPDDDVYKKGVRFLMETQKADGSWIVDTRSEPVQVFFDNGDPGGKSQFISFAATGWAVLALLETVPRKE
jgi:squalene cyclase